MFDDPGVRQLFFHAGTKLVVLAGLVLLWFAWSRRRLLPYVNANRLGSTDQDTGSASQAPLPFPIYSLVGCCVLTVAFIYYATFETGFRQVNKIDNQLVKRRNQALVQEEIKTKQSVVPPDEQETLEEISRRKLDQAQKDNAAGVDDFQKLTPVDPVTK